MAIVIDTSGPVATVIATVNDLQADVSGVVTRTMSDFECDQKAVAHGTRGQSGVAMDPGEFSRAKVYVLACLAACTAPNAGVALRYFSNPSDAPGGQTIQVSISEYAAS